jgi:hypothetical protein
MSCPSFCILCIAIIWLRYSVSQLSYSVSKFLSSSHIIWLSLTLFTSVQAYCLDEIEDGGRVPTITYLKHCLAMFFLMSITCRIIFVSNISEDELHPSTLLLVRNVKTGN